MSADDVQATLDQALEVTGLDQVQVRCRPRLLSDNVLTAKSISLLVRHDHVLPSRGIRLLLLSSLRQRSSTFSGPRLTIVT
jgi:hypothetical protein